MTDEMATPSPGEEPAQPETSEAPREVRQPAVDEMPTAIIASSEEEKQLSVSDEVTQTMTTVDVAEESIHITPIVPATESPMYEHSGATSEPAPPSTPYPAMDAPSPQYVAPVFYANMPQPGQPAQPVAAAPVRSRYSPVLLFAIIALAAFLLGGGSVFAYGTLKTPAASSLSSPNATLQKYCDGINHANAQEIYDTLSSQAKVHASLDDIQKFFEGLSELNSLSSSSSMTFGNCKISNVRVSGDLAVATITTTTSITFSGSTLSTSTPGLVSLVVEKDQWKIDFSQLAQPQPNITGSLFPGLLTPTPGQ